MVTGRLCGPAWAWFVTYVDVQPAPFATGVGGWSLILIRPFYGVWRDSALRIALEAAVPIAVEPHAMIVADLNVSVVANRDAIAVDALVAAYASSRWGGNQEDGKGEREAHGSVFSLASIVQLLCVIIGARKIVENMFPQPSRRQAEKGTRRDRKAPSSW